MSYNLNSFPLRKNGAGIATGTVSGNIILCVKEGDVTFNWKDGGAYTETMVAGISYDLQDCTSVTITSGTFHIG